MSGADNSVLGLCRSRGISRRRFLEFCAAVNTTLVLPASYAQVIATALSQKRKPVLVWLEFQDCAGNTESMLRSSHPTVEDLVLEAFSWEYHETIMATYGKAAEAALNRVVREDKGKYIVVFEGAIPTADGGVRMRCPGHVSGKFTDAVSIQYGRTRWRGRAAQSTGRRRRPDRRC
jgi:hydrogenase small subunit